MFCESKNDCPANRFFHHGIHRTIIIVLIFCFVLSQPNPATAKDKQAPGLSMKDIMDMSLEDLLHLKVTTASRSAKSIQELPVTVFVITRDDILSNNYRSLVEILKELPGIKISQPGNGNDGDTFLMRGLYGNNYTKILLNGMPVSPTVAGGMPLGSQLNVKSIERIEVIYGPASALYGADALSGVINIVTYAPGVKIARGEIVSGSNGYTGYNFFLGGSTGNNRKPLMYSLYGMFDKMNEQPIYENHEAIYDPSLYDPYSYGEGVFPAPWYPNYRGTRTEPEMAGIPTLNRSFGLKLSYENLHFTYNYLYRRQHSSIGQVTSWYGYYDPEIFWGETIRQFALKYTRTFGEALTFNTTISYLKYRLDERSSLSFNFEGGIGGKVFKYAASDDLLGELVGIWQAASRLEIVGGLTYQYSGAMPKSNDLVYPFDPDDYKPFSEEKPPPHPVLGHFGYNNYLYNNKAVFLQGTYATNKVTLMVGARYDDHSQYGDTFNPRVAFMVNVTKKFSLRTSYSEAFRAPTGYYLYNCVAVEGQDGINYINIPNPGLVPETFACFDAGFRFRFSGNATLEMIGFYYRLRRLIAAGRGPVDPEIYPNPVNETAGVFINDNDSEAKLLGLDLVLTMRDIVSSINLDSDISISYARGKTVLPGAEGEIDDIVAQPRWMMKFKLSARPVKNLYAGIFGLFSGASYSRGINLLSRYTDPYYKIDGYFTIDITAKYKLFNNISVLIKVNNLTDEVYGGIDAYRGDGALKYNPQYGRCIYAGIEFTQ
ncbi:MAG: TonB-dependent receptor [bacterium]|nr:TonB-dependent receptor [bacterium]